MKEGHDHIGFADELDSKENEIERGSNLMISKDNITRCTKSIKQLISRCESYEEFDKDGNLRLPVEKTESSFITISKDQLKDYESNGMSIVDLHQKLEERVDECKWKETSYDIQIPKPKLRTKIF